MQFGSLRLDIVPGGRFRLDGESLFGVVPKALWERQFPADASNRVGLTANCLLVRGAGFTALIETGPGDKWHVPGTRALRGRTGAGSLDRSSGARGVAPGGRRRRRPFGSAVRPRGRRHRSSEGRRCAPAFPNATLYVQAAELAHARTPAERDRASYRPENWEAYAEAGLLEALDGEARIRPGVTVVPLKGHSGGMQAIRIESGGKTAFYFSDAIPTSAHIPIAWVMAHDTYPVALLADKKRLLDRAAAEGWLCVFEHDPDVPWGHVGRRAQRETPRPRRADRPRRVLTRSILSEAAATKTLQVRAGGASFSNGRR